MGVLATIGRRHGRTSPIFSVADRSALQPMWSFSPSRPRPREMAVRALSFATGLRYAPPRRELIAPGAAASWTCYFVYAPDGRLSAAHRYTLSRLKESRRRLMVVCAAPSPSAVPAELFDQADALLWKGVRGFDFSAYAYGLETLSRRAPGADVLVMNDSVYGPFSDFDALLERAPWRLTGFTAYSMIENHLQSYAFHLRGLTPETLKSLRAVMPKRVVFDRYRDVVHCQETRLARVAARSMTVGALWFADTERCGDPTLYAGVDLLEAGFPFLKRSLFFRNKDIQPRRALTDILRDHGHPVPTDGERDDL